MINKTILEYADNGVIIRHENGLVEIKEDNSQYGDEYFKGMSDTQKTLAEAYGEIVANTLECFSEEEYRKAVGFKVNIEVVPVFDEKKLIPKQKR